MDILSPENLFVKRIFFWIFFLRRCRICIKLFNCSVTQRINELCILGVVVRYSQRHSTGLPCTRKHTDGAAAYPGSLTAPFASKAVKDTAPATHCRASTCKTQRRHPRRGMVRSKQPRAPCKHPHPISKRQTASQDHCTEPSRGRAESWSGSISLPSLSSLRIWLLETSI